MTKTTELLHPVHDVNKGCFDSYSRKRIDILHPTEDMICIEDIANALSNISRFGGHTKPGYNVAQHSLLVAAIAPSHLKKAALLHDAAEAYLGDVIKPLKVLLGSRYAAMEAEFEEVIFSKFGVSIVDLEAIKQYDKWALEVEHDHFFKGGSRLNIAVNELFGGIVDTIWDAELSEKTFLKTFQRIWSAVEIANIKQLPQHIEVTAREMAADPEGLVDTYNHDIYLSDEVSN